MSYTTGIPTTGQSLGNSRPQIQGNFNYINTTLKVNHYFNESNAGKHRFVDLVEQGSNPAPAAGTDTLFTRVSSGIGELFYVRGGGGTPIQMTNVDPVNAQKGSTFLPGGLLMQWDFVTIGASGSSTTVNYLQNFTLAGVNVDPYAVLLTPNAPVNNILTLSLSTGGFVAASKAFDIRRQGGSGATMGVQYVAIGPRT